MRTATMWKPVALLDLGLRPLTNERAVNSTERMVARDVPKRLPLVAVAMVYPADLPAFLRRQAE